LGRCSRRDNDNTSNSENELVNGLDWFPFRLRGDASYEVLPGGITGAVGNVNTGSPALELLASDGSTSFGSSSPVTSLGIARRLSLFYVDGDFEQVGYVHAHTLDRRSGGRDVERREVAEKRSTRRSHDTRDGSVAVAAVDDRL
jgi:hypothetical protein